jgi:putative transposase
MIASLAILDTFLAEKRDSREYRRGLAVKMAYKGYLYADICAILEVSPGFISQWKQAFETAGVAGLVLKYKGAQSYLDPDERTAVIAWLKAQETWNVDYLKQHLERTYGVLFQSRQSYYELLDAAGITWKKAQRINPAKDPAIVAANKKRLANNL